MNSDDWGALQREAHAGRLPFPNAILSPEPPPPSLKPLPLSPGPYSPTKAPPNGASSMGTYARKILRTTLFRASVVPLHYCMGHRTL